NRAPVPTSTESSASLRIVNTSSAVAIRHPLESIATAGFGHTLRPRTLYFKCFFVVPCITSAHEPRAPASRLRGRCPRRLVLAGCTGAPRESACGLEARRGAGGGAGHEAARSRPQGNQPDSGRRRARRLRPPCGGVARQR